MDRKIWEAGKRLVWKQQHGDPASRRWTEMMDQIGDRTDQRGPFQQNQELKRELRCNRFEGVFFGLGLVGSLVSGALFEGGSAMAGVAVSWFAAAGVAHALYGGE